MSGSEMSVTVDPVLVGVGSDERVSNVSSSGSLAEDFVLDLLSTSDAGAGAIDSVSKDIAEVDDLFLDLDVSEPSLVSSLCELRVFVAEDVSVSEADAWEDVCLDKVDVLPNVFSVIETFVIFSFVDKAVVVKSAVALLFFESSISSTFLNSRQKPAAASPLTGIVTVFVASRTTRCSSRVFGGSCSTWFSQNS